MLSVFLVPQAKGPQGHHLPVVSPSHPQIFARIKDPNALYRPNQFRVQGRQDWTAEELVQTEEYVRQEAHGADGADGAVEDDDEAVPDTSDDSEGEEDQGDGDIGSSVGISPLPLLFVQAMQRIHSESLNLFQSNSKIGICIGHAVSHSLHSAHFTGSRCIPSILFF